jgi:hypothetical protein
MTGSRFPRPRPRAGEAARQAGITRETCTGTRAITAKNMTAGRIIDTATATATGGAPVTSNSSRVIVREGWPPPLTGIYTPPVKRPHGLRALHYR